MSLKPNHMLEQQTLNYIKEYGFFRKHFMYLWHKMVDQDGIQKDFNFAVSHPSSTVVHAELDIFYKNIYKTITEIIQFSKYSNNWVITDQDVVNRAHQLIGQRTAIKDVSYEFDETDSKELMDLFLQR